VQRAMVERLEDCHVALVDTGEPWKVLYRTLLLTYEVMLHENDNYMAVLSVFETIGASAHFSLLRIGENKDNCSFFADGSGTNYIAQARKREFVEGETGAEYKARRELEPGGGPFRDEAEDV
jgi:hypothetical protein